MGDRKSDGGGCWSPFMGSRKGMSPIIITTLLVLFTIAIALLLSIWSKGY